MTDGERRCEKQQAGGADGVERASGSLIDDIASSILKGHAWGGPQAMATLSSSIEAKEFSKSVSNEKFGLVKKEAVSIHLEPTTQI